MLSPRTLLDPQLFAALLPGVGRDQSRRFVDRDGRRWQIRECAAPKHPCPRGTRCLIFESEGVARRVWSYPDDWDTLDESALDALSRST